MPPEAAVEVDILGMDFKKLYSIIKKKHQIYRDFYVGSGDFGRIILLVY